MMDKELLKKLRAETNASFSDCKQALMSTNNYDEAIQWLRSHGAAKAVKKMSAEATEGVITLKIVGKKAVMMEINCQTDFVAKNEMFLAFANELSELVIKTEAKTVDEVNNLKFDKEGSVEQKITSLIAVTGEKIALRRFVSVTAPNEIGGYLHANKRIGVIVLAEGGDATQLKHVAMHIAAMSPNFIDESKIDEKWREKELQILKSQLENEGKPKEFVDRIIEGRYHKILQESVLIHQDFILDQKIKVNDFLKKNNIKVTDMIRFEIGEKI